MKSKLIATALLSWLGFLNSHLTASAQSVVTTLPATAVTAANATLNGTVNPLGAATAAYFQYGLTTNYGNIGTATVLPATNGVLALPGWVVSSLRGAAGPDVGSPNAPIGNWYSLAASADGLRLVAPSYSGGIYISTNGGESWTQSGAPFGYWQSIASSADGTRLAAVTYGNGIYFSTNSGATWTPSSMTTGYWYSVACSLDGTRMAAAASGGIFTSADGGQTWAQSSAPATSWQSIASSADGQRLAAAIYNGGIYTSTNSGSTWTQSGASSRKWQSIASSADGLRLAAAGYAGVGIYTSTNGGVTWTQANVPTSQDWPGIASSADGRRLAAVEYPGYLYTSADGGLTWASGAFATVWQSVASSADGTRLAAAQRRGSIFTATGPSSNLLPGTLYHYQLVGINHAGTTLGSDLTFTTLGGAPTVTITRSGSSVVIAWPAAVRGVLQQSTGLAPAAWTDAPSGTNNPATFPATGAAKYYRLIQ